MKRVICPVCKGSCVRNGFSQSGTQRWICKQCSISVTPQIDTSAKQLQVFLDWLFGKHSQTSMPGEGRSFRRKTSVFWNIWPMPPKIEEHRDIVFLDGIYLGRKACVLICCDKEHVLGWYVCRFEHAGAWAALMKRIAEPTVVVSDGGSGFTKALRQVWPHARHQRCLFHIFCQVKRYTTNKPKTLAGRELYALSKDLLHLETKEETENWTNRFVHWMVKNKNFLSQMTRDEYGELRPTHERILKAQRSLAKLLKEGTMFIYLDESLKEEIGMIPRTNNQIEGGINARLRAMLREHRGLSIERRIKAVYWWCYMHSPKPLPITEIIDAMPTDKSIDMIYKRMNEKAKLEKSLSYWGDAVAWGEFHQSTEYPNSWD